MSKYSKTIGEIEIECPYCKHNKSYKKRCTLVYTGCTSFFIKEQAPYSRGMRRSDACYGLNPRGRGV